MISFKLNEKEFIELNKLLKILNLVESGGMANVMISDGAIMVNDEQEFRKRKKLRKGDIIEFDTVKIEITD